MATKSKKVTSSVTDLVAGGEEKMHKIVDEVDRFFKSVHADIEDWKFSMEDYGDGTRIFVRFQIHINDSGVASHPGKAKANGPSARRTVDREVTLTASGGRTLPDGREVTEDIHKPDGTGAARRADLDLASFVEVWRNKQESTDSSLGTEFHKEGAPYMDAQSEWKGHKRSTEDTSPGVGGEHVDENPKASHAKA
ncbi:MAG: hypothetical protein WB778_00395 [Thermoplasmata archaeon]